MAHRPDHRPPPPGEFVQADGLRLHVERVGATPPRLLLLHGFLSSASAWREAARTLAARGVGTAALDLPGAGYSERPLDVPYTPVWLADRIPAVLDALGLEAAVLGGHSLGGAVALYTAARHPARVEGLVLVSPLVYRPPPPPGLRIAARVPGFMQLVFRSPPGRLTVRALLHRAAYANRPDLAAATARELLDHLDAPGGWAAATLTGVRAIPGAPETEELRAVRARALVLWGELDRVQAKDSGPRLCAELGGASRLVVLPKAGHNAHMEQPLRFAALTAAWLMDRLPPPGELDLAGDPF